MKRKRATTEGTMILPPIRITHDLRRALDTRPADATTARRRVAVAGSGVATARRQQVTTGDAPATTGDVRGGITGRGRQQPR